MAEDVINHQDDKKPIGPANWISPVFDAIATMRRHKYWSEAPTRPPAAIADKIISIEISPPIILL
jgi:hypothetical protein